MSNRGFQWQRAALAAVLSLAVLSLGYYAYDRYGVTGPLERMLKSDPDVISVRLGTEGGVQKIVVQLAEVQDLETTYTRLYQKLIEKLGEGSFTFEVTDTRSAELDEAYFDIHYYVEEASENGDFGYMISASRESLKGKDMDKFRIKVGKDRIFVEMIDNGSYLYEVVQRSNAGRGGTGL